MKLLDFENATDPFAGLPDISEVGQLTEADRHCFEELRIVLHKHGKQSQFGDHLIAKAANGKRPTENARRQRTYEEAKVAALKAAEPVKAAEDHRLRCQIRELEGLAETVAQKETDVRRILATL